MGGYKKLSSLAFLMTCQMGCTSVVHAMDEQEDYKSKSGIVSHQELEDMLTKKEDEFLAAQIRALKEAAKQDLDADEATTEEDEVLQQARALIEEKFPTIELNLKEEETQVLEPFTSYSDRIFVPNSDQTK